MLELAILGLLKERSMHGYRLSEIKTSLKNYRERIDAYTLSLMRHGADATEQDIAWLDGLIETERRQVRTTTVKVKRAGRTGEGTRRRSVSKLPAKETAR